MSSNDLTGVGSPPPRTSVNNLDDVPASGTSTSPGLAAPDMQAGENAAASLGLAGLGLSSIGPTLPKPTLSVVDAMIALQLLARASKNAGIKSAESDIKQRGIDEKAENDKTVRDAKKVNEAAHKKNIGGIFAKVFAWIGVALSFVVAGVVAVVSGGTAAAPLFAIAIAGAGLALMQQTGGMDKMMDAMHMSDEAKMAFSLSIAAAMLVVNISVVVFTGGASLLAGAAELAQKATSALMQTGGVVAEASATAAEAGTEVAIELAEVGTEIGAEIGAEVGAEVAEGATTVSEGIAETSFNAVDAAVDGTSEIAEAPGEIAETSEEIAQAAEEVAETTGEGVAKTATDGATKSPRLLTLANRVRGASSIAQGAASIGSAGASTEQGVDGYEASMAQADSMRARAKLEALASLDEEAITYIRKMVESMQRTMDIVNGVQDNFQEARKHISSHSAA